DEGTEHSGYKCICGCVTRALPLWEENDMASATLTLHFCSVHDLLFCPPLQACLSSSQLQIEPKFRKAMRLKERAWPRFMAITTEARDKELENLFPASVPLQASGF